MPTLDPKPFWRRNNQNNPIDRKADQVLCGKQNDNDPERRRSFPLPLIVGFVAVFLATQQLLSHPPSVQEFDIDFFLALDRSLNAPPVEEQILELPSLSPAEQIVGAFFGPPHSHKY